MHFDISQLLERWDFQPGRVSVRKFTGKEGIEKLQLRIDLGLLQMNASGRPDGKRPMGFASLFDCFQDRLNRHISESGGEAGFVLRAEDCSKLQVEALQYHHRYVCLLELEDYEGVERDTRRNMELLAFVAQYAASTDLAWSLQQFFPQLLMVHTRARASLSLKSKEFDQAIACIQGGIEQLRAFFIDHSRQDLMDHSTEIRSLEAWLSEIRRKKPLSQRERIELALQDALQREDYEEAAKMRDALRNLSEPNTTGEV